MNNEIEPRNVDNLTTIDHAITGIGTEDGYTKWHIYADYGNILDLTVGWSSGNPFYYGYGFNIQVVDAPAAPQLEMPTVKSTRIG